jgi:uncharacterized lipoprotein
MTRTTRRLTTLAAAAALMLTAGCGAVDAAKQSVSDSAKSAAADVAGDVRDENFVNALRDRGIVNPNPNVTVNEVAMAKDVCVAVKEMGSVQDYVAYLVTETPNASREDLEYIAKFSGVAVAYYCPNVVTQ